MPTNPYERVRSAALALDRNDSTGRWKLADAILAHIPARSEGRPPGNSIDTDGVSDLLAELAQRLEGDDVRTTRGDTYSPVTLRNLRDTAAAWPLDDRRQSVASFSVHQEVAKNAAWRLPFFALCRVAEGENVRCPRACDAPAWAAARTRVDLAGNRVTVDTIRTAMGARTTRQPSDLIERIRTEASDPTVAAAAAEALVETAPVEAGTAVGRNVRSRQTAITTPLDGASDRPPSVTPTDPVDVRWMETDRMLENLGAVTRRIGTDVEANRDVWNVVRKSSLVESIRNLLGHLETLGGVTDDEVRRYAEWVRGQSSVFEDMVRGVTDADLARLLDEGDA